MNRSARTDHNISLVTVTELHSIAPNYAQTTWLHMQALGSLHSQADRTPMGYILITCSTPHMPALGKGFCIGFCQGLCQHASYTSVATSTFSKLPCFTLAYMTRQKCINASTGLFTVYTFDHSSYALSGIQPKDLDWANHIFSGYGS